MYYHCFHTFQTWLPEHSNVRSENHVEFLCRLQGHLHKSFHRQFEHITTSQPAKSIHQIDPQSLAEHAHFHIFTKGGSGCTGILHQSFNRQFEHTAADQSARNIHQIDPKAWMNTHIFIFLQNLDGVEAVHASSIRRLHRLHATIRKGPRCFKLYSFLRPVPVILQMHIQGTHQGSS